MMENGAMEKPEPVKTHPTPRHAHRARDDQQPGNIHNPPSLSLSLSLSLLFFVCRLRCITERFSTWWTSSPRWWGCISFSSASPTDPSDTVAPASARPTRFASSPSNKHPAPTPAETLVI